MPATSQAHPQTIDDNIAAAIADALTRGALPGETVDLTDEGRAAAGAFVAEAATERAPNKGTAKVSSAGSAGASGSSRVDTMTVLSPCPRES